MTKFTLKVRPLSLAVAAEIAKRFLTEYSPRTRYGAVIVAYAAPPVLGADKTSFAVWGDEKHVRVYQSED